MGSVDGNGEADQIPLLQSGFQPMSPSVKRTGNLWTAIAHIITGVIGAGVLSLAWAMAQLGWIAGPVSMVLFSCVAITSVFLLCDCYMSPDPKVGPIRHRSYLEAVKHILGARDAWVSGMFLFINAYSNGIAYTITSAICMRAIQKSNCYHKEGHGAACNYGDTSYMLIFGVVQIVMSQIPDFHNMAWLSFVAAVMSFAYTSIGLGLGIAKTIANGAIKGSISGTSASAFGKAWLVAQALGDIAFSCHYSLIQIEIQDTLRSPPPETNTMKKASGIAISITTLFYLSIAGFGYAAFGDDAPGNLLTGFGFYEPYWLVDFANACIVLHVIGAYQIYSQPLFGVVDRWVCLRFPRTEFINREYNLKAPLLPGFRLNLFRLCFRTIYVISITAVAVAFPYFNQVLGVLGALNFWPLGIYFPVKMYCIQKGIEPRSRNWIVLQSFSIVCLAATVYVLTGSAEGVIAARFG